MNRCIPFLVMAACIAWPGLGLAQSQPTPSREDAERNAFQTPATGLHKQGEPDYSRDKNPLAGSQGAATNPEGKNITEPTGRPTKASPNSPEK
jgi:hypothetical protein